MAILRIRDAEGKVHEITAIMGEFFNATNLANYNDGNSDAGGVGISEEGGSTEVVTSLPTDGLVAAFDFRNPNVNVDSSKGLTTFAPLTGSGCLFTWSATAYVSHDDYGSKVSRSLSYSHNGDTTQTEFGSTYTWCFFGHSNAFNGAYTSGDHSYSTNVAQVNLRPKYNNTSGNQTSVAGANYGEGVEGYHSFVFSVNGAEMKVYIDGSLVETYDGSSYDGFVSWYSKLLDSAQPGNDKTSRTYLAVYDKALTADEVSTVNAYFETLEVV